jgi:hypothetical protein
MRSAPCSHSSNVPTIRIFTGYLLVPKQATRAARWWSWVGSSRDLDR